MPHFDGYVAYRSSSLLSTWRTLWVVLDGHYLRSFRSRDSSNGPQPVPFWGEHITDCEIKANDKKLTLKIKSPGKSRPYELRLRDNDEFKCWQVALQRSLSWKDPIKHDGVSLSGAPSCDSIDIEATFAGSDLFGDIEVPALTEDLTFDDIADQRKKIKRVLVTRIEALHAAYEKLDKKVINRGDDVSTFIRTTRETLTGLASYVLFVENERDQWITRWEEEHKQFKDLDDSINQLARNHHKLESSLLARAMGDVPPDDDDSMQVDIDQEDEDDDAQFYDAQDDNGAFGSPVVRAHSSRHVSASPASAAAASRASSSAASPAGAQLQRLPTQLIVTPPSSGVLSFKRRDRLPANRSKQKASAWAILKHSIGKDLSRIGFPIIFNEPLSGLQRMCEDLEYAEILDHACKLPSSTERLAYLAIFTVTNYSTVIGRTNKPFNPILGETYECLRPERGKGWRYIAEQVSHHPPVSAMYAHSLEDGWRWQEVMQVTNSFRGMDLEVYPLGYSHVWIPAFKEHYTWKKVTTCVKNVIIGTMWMDNFGECVITNHQTGDTCKLVFKAYSYMTGNVGVVEGTVCDKSGRAHWIIGGKWNESITIQPADQSVPAKTVWRRLPQPPLADVQFNMTAFAVSLNEIEPGSEKYLPPTDCRLRSDQRLYEEAKLEEAQKEKEHLEDIQRHTRRLREARGETYHPRFFTNREDPDLKINVWDYSGNYWERRQKADWADMPHIYEDLPGTTTK